MKKSPLLFTLAIVGLCIAVNYSCKKESSDPCDDMGATYNEAVKSIIDNTCAYAGCHDGSNSNPYMPAESGDYTTYEGMQANLENGKFTERVLETMNMPNPAFVPSGRPASLTTEEIAVLTCWKDNGFAKQ